MDKKEYLNKGGVWKNDYKKDAKDGKPDFTGNKGAGLHLKIQNGDTNYKDEVIVKDIESLVTYDKEGNAYPFLIKDANGNIVGIELRLNVKSWKRKEGGKSNAPVLSIQVEPNVNSGNENQIPFPKESETGNNMSNDDIPF